MVCNCSKSDPLDENTIVQTCEDEKGQWQKLIYLMRKPGQKTWRASIRERGSPLRPLPAVVDHDTSLINLRNRVEKLACGGGKKMGRRA